jgi:isopentenyl-diphosphate delta-isomerase type 1
VVKEQLILVNDQDQAVGSEEKLAAHQQGLLHRAFSVFVLRNHEGAAEMLLQQRHIDKYHAGGLWTNSCCGHPRPGEQTQAAAERRLQEETGLRLGLQPVGIFQYRAEFDNGLIEHEVDHVFVGHYDGQALSLHPQEIEAIAWRSIAWVRQDLQRHVVKYTPWFAQALVVLESGMSR